MPLLLLRWRQVGREADGGVGAQRVQGVWFGEASGGQSCSAARAQGRRQGGPCPSASLPTTLKNKVTGQ